MKRALALMLAVVLVLSLGITAFAATDDGKITVGNAINGVNYKLYKIFDATYKPATPPDDGDDDNNGIVDVVSYTLSTDSPVYTYMFGNVDTVDGFKNNGTFVYEVATGVITVSDAIIDEDDNVDDDAIFVYLTDMVRALYDVDAAPADDKCFVANQTASVKEGADEASVEFTGLDYGYYLIDSEKASDNTEDKAKIAVTITTNTPAIEVYEKNIYPGQLEKETDVGSVSIGDVIPWEVSFVATNSDGIKLVKYYTITDTLSSDWAIYNFSETNTTNITVKVGDQTLTAGTDYTLEMTNVDGKPGFKINIPWLKNDGTSKYGATETVTITYTTTVTAKAASDKLTTELVNTAGLSWNNGVEVPGVGDDKETYIFNMGFQKVDGDTDAGLGGAQFALYQKVPMEVDGEETIVDVLVNVSGSNGVYVVDPAGTATIESPADGNVVIKGLEAGEYKLVETKAPDGYNKLATAIDVTIDATNSTDIGDYIISNDTNSRLIENNQGVELPSTGGKGTMMLITFGTMIAVAFAILMITQKKMSIYND